MGLDPQVCAIAQSEVGWRRAGRGPPPVMVPCRPAAERRGRTAEVEESQDAGAGSRLASMPRRDEVGGGRRETGQSFRRGGRLAGRSGRTGKTERRRVSVQQDLLFFVAGCAASPIRCDGVGQENGGGAPDRSVLETRRLQLMSRESPLCR